MSDQRYAEQNITDWPYMASLLRQIKSSRSMVTIRIDKDPTLFNTMLIDVLPNDKLLFLDELGVEKGHKKIKKGSTIHFDGRLRGVRIQFSSKVKSIATEDGIALYCLPFPQQMQYWQRRRHYRAMVHEEPLAICIPLPLQRSVTGKIIDISASGVCTQVNYRDSSLLHAEQAFHDATITLPGSSEINCDIEVRSIRHFPDQGYSLIGSEFIDIQPQQQMHVERIVAMLDRNQRRTHSH